MITTVPEDIKEVVRNLVVEQEVLNKARVELDYFLGNSYYNDASRTAAHITNCCISMERLNRLLVERCKKAGISTIVAMASW